MLEGRCPSWIRSHAGSDDSVAEYESDKVNDAKLQLHIVDGVWGNLVRVRDIIDLLSV